MDLVITFSVQKNDKMDQLNQATRNNNLKGKVNYSTTKKTKVVFSPDLLMIVFSIENVFLIIF